MVANEGVSEAITSFFRDDSYAVFLGLCFDLRPNNIFEGMARVEESNTRLEKWRATWNAHNSKTDKN